MVGRGGGGAGRWGRGAGTDEEPTPFEFLQLSIQTMLNVTLAEVRAHPFPHTPAPPHPSRYPLTPVLPYLLWLDLFRRCLCLKSFAAFPPQPLICAVCCIQRDRASG